MSSPVHSTLNARESTGERADDLSIKEVKEPELPKGGE